MKGKGRRGREGGAEVKRDGWEGQGGSGGEEGEGMGGVGEGE